jgi:hypothetical protein
MMGRATIPRLIASVAAATLAAGSAVALGGTAYPRQVAKYTLSTHVPDHSTGERFKFDYVNPDDPQGKPPAVSRVVTALPRGSHYDASVPGSCGASDAELMLEGGASCPADSAIGGGVVTVDTGLPGPARIVTADVEFFNNAADPSGEFIYVNTVRGTGARTVIRADVTRRRTITAPGMLPGTPPDGGAIDTADLVVNAVSSHAGGHTANYITTRRSCPASGRWITHVAFTYPDGVTQRVHTPIPCHGR